MVVDYYQRRFHESLTHMISIDVPAARAIFSMVSRVLSGGTWRVSKASGNGVHVTDLLMRKERIM
jgi:hypothetical protein